MIKLTDLLNENVVDDHNDSSVPYGSGYDKMKEELSSKDRTLIYKLTTMALKEMPNSPKQKKIIKKLNLIRTKNGMKSISEGGVITEVGVFPIAQFIKTMIPDKLYDTTTSRKKEKLRATISDLKRTLNQFWKQHDIPYRVK